MLEGWTGEENDDCPRSQGIEDALGYMDFKSAGTEKGVTSLQVCGDVREKGGETINNGYLAPRRWTSNRCLGYPIVSSRKQ